MLRRGNKLASATRSTTHIVDLADGGLKPPQLIAMTLAQGAGW
jgi:hypothetical protein